MTEARRLHPPSASLRSLCTVLVQPARRDRLRVRNDLRRLRLLPDHRRVPPTLRAQADHAERNQQSERAAIYTRLLDTLTAETA